MTMNKTEKAYARALQDEFASDPTLAPASYSWCLMQVRAHRSGAMTDAQAEMPEGGDGREFRARVIVKLIERIKPLARKAG